MEKLSAPLTSLLKKNDFIWNKAVNKCFQDLQIDMCMTLVISLAGFTKNFVLECETIGKGTTEILMQEVIP